MADLSQYITGGMVPEAENRRQNLSDYLNATDERFPRIKRAARKYQAFQQGIDPISQAAQQQRALTSDNRTSWMKDVQFYKGLPPEDQEMAMDIRRSDPDMAWQNVGGQVIQPGTGKVINKTLPPQRTITNDGRVITVGASGGVDAQDVQSPKQKKDEAFSVRKKIQDKQRIKALIYDAIDLVNPWSTGFGRALRDIPGTDANKLQNILDQVAAIAGFNNLQEVTAGGGSLGALSESEMRLLQAMAGNLSTNADSTTLKSNLERMAGELQMSIDDLRYRHGIDEVQ